MTLFVIDEFGWHEMVVAAEVWSEWQRFVQTVRQALVRLDLASKTRQMPITTKLSEASNDFR